jgi:ATP-dependent Lhr-like helicase
VRAEWCERRLLARIHHYTLDRLRKEIEPTTGAEFMRFLFRWQRISPDARGEGPDALAAVLAQLEGFEAAAGAWESDILPGRVRGYDPAWLDALCLSGKYVWARMSPTQARAPVKSSPIALLPRRRAAVWRTAEAEDATKELSGAARRVMEVLANQGASFFDEIAEAAGLLDTQTESALAELVARGLANADSFKGLRALLMPEEKKRRFRGVNPFGMEDAGRWRLLNPPAGRAEVQDFEHIAGVLLRRYGVVFRALLTREAAAPPWWELLKIYRRLEARGEIRGGRFVAGQYGEQFALPEAIESLRAVRKQPGENEIHAIAAADPLNLAGIIGPGQKLPAQPGARVLYKAGIPIAFLSGKDIRWLVEPESGEEWDLKNRLLRRETPPRLKAYL